MKSFWIILAATLVAASAIGVERLTQAYRHSHIQIIVGICLIVIFITLSRVLVKWKE